MGSGFQHGLAFVQACLQHGMPQKHGSRREAPARPCGHAAKARHARMACTQASPCMRARALSAMMAGGSRPRGRAQVNGLAPGGLCVWGAPTRWPACLRGPRRRPAAAPCWPGRSGPQPSHPPGQSPRSPGRHAQASGTPKVAKGCTWGLGYPAARQDAWVGRGLCTQAQDTPGVL